MISVEIRVKYFLVAFTNIHQIIPPILKYVKTQFPVYFYSIRIFLPQKKSRPIWSG